MNARWIFVLANVVLFADALESRVSTASPFRFSNLYRSGMILQREPESATIWGYKNTTDELQVALDCTKDDKQLSPQNSRIVLEDENIWKIELDPQLGGTSCNILVTSASEGEIALQNVLFGDVWLCSGQSNMLFPMKDVYNATAEMEDAKRYTQIKYTRVHRDGATKIADDKVDIILDHGWETAGDAHFYQMSAICYFFARNLYDELGVPMGLINSDFGGTKIESWSSQDVLDTCEITHEQSGCNDDNSKRCNTRLWNSMVNPLKRNTLKGFLWYQGEANIAWNTDVYACTFTTLISNWRSEFSLNSNTNIQAPFGFVQLSTITYNDPDIGTPQIRWHQTADQGFAPNPEQSNTFMAVAIDTYDEPNGVHPHYKQIIGERLFITGMRMAYRNEEYPTGGPRVIDRSVTDDKTMLTVTYSQPITYDQSEISGFYYCCIEYQQCDNDAGNWFEFMKGDVTHNGNEIHIKLGNFIGWCEMKVPHVAYLWRQTPIKGYLAAPIYGNDKFSLPSGPWKLEFGQE